MVKIDVQYVISFKRGYGFSGKIANFEVTLIERFGAKNQRRGRGIEKGLTNQ